MGNFIQGWGLIVFLDYGFVEVMGVYTDAEGFIGLLGVCQGGNPFCWFSDRGYNLEVNHFLQGFSMASLHSMGTFLHSCCTGGMDGSM